ncbi:hypothetical protein ACQ4PT_022236 [Festuca glaucescens]
MSTSALLSALHVAGRQHVTASTIGARQATGSHVFRIEWYTQLREQVANGTAVNSGLFSVGGHDWRIQCYPNGDTEQTQGSVSLFLTQASHAKPGDVMASFKMSILDNSWKPSRTGVEEKGDRFMGDDWGRKKFMKLEDLDKEKHLEDDCLSVLCDVTVDLGLRTDDYTDEVPAAAELAKTPPPFHLHGLNPGAERQRT